jgi:SulP family sulfate permease
MLLTIIFDLTIAIEVGLVLAVVLFVRRIMETSHISVLRNEMGLHHDGEDGEVQLAIPDKVEVYEIEGPFFFGVATRFEELASKRDAMPIRIVRMRKVTFIDSTGVHNLEIFVDAAIKNGQTIILSGVNDKVYRAIERAGIVAKLGKENVLDHIDKALERANKLSEQLKKQ